MQLTLVYLPACQTCNAAQLLPALEEMGVTAEALRLRHASTGGPGAREVMEPGPERTLSVDPQGGLYLAHFFASVYSRGELVVVVGGGVDPTLELLQQMLERAEAGADVVIASRYHGASRISYPWRRLLVSKGYNLLVSLLLSTGTTDSRSGLKLYRREVLAQALRMSPPQRVAYDVQLLASVRRLGCAVAEVPARAVYAHSPYNLSLAEVRQGVVDTLRLFYTLRVKRNLGRSR